MKKSKFLLPCVVCAATAMVILLASCSKAKDGKDGVDGTNGANGAPGAQGPPGTANVIYSNWTDTLTYFLASATTTDTIVGELLAPGITADILNKGDVKVYVNLNTTADPVIVPLPYRYGDGYIDVLFFVGGFDIESNLNLPGFPLRYIIIPGGTAARRTGIVDWNNYASVKAYLHLKD
jgi:hypothetical protein